MDQKIYMQFRAGVSVVRPVVISRKLYKTDPQLQWNTIRKLVPLVLMSHFLDPRAPDAPLGR